MNKNYGRCYALLNANRKSKKFQVPEKNVFLWKVKLMWANKMEMKN